MGWWACGMPGQGWQKWRSQGRGCGMPGQGWQRLWHVWASTTVLSVGTTVLQEKSGILGTMEATAHCGVGRMDLLPLFFFLPAGCKRLRISFKAEAPLQPTTSRLLRPVDQKNVAVTLLWPPALLFQNWPLLLSLFPSPKQSLLSNFQTLKHTLFFPASFSPKPQLFPDYCSEPLFSCLDLRVVPRTKHGW